MILKNEESKRLQTESERPQCPFRLIRFVVGRDRKAMLERYHTFVHVFKDHLTISFVQAFNDY